MANAIPAAVLPQDNGLNQKAQVQQVNQAEEAKTRAENIRNGLVADPYQGAPADADANLIVNGRVARFVKRDVHGNILRVDW